VSVDTSNVSSSFVVTTVDGKEHPIVGYQEFSLSVPSGRSISVAISFPQLAGIFKTGKLMPSGAERVVSALRTMLREKKGGI
jgi:hypothetical protein